MGGAVTIARVPRSAQSQGGNMKRIAMALAMSALAGACGDSQTPDTVTPDAGTNPTTDFLVRIENIAPWTVLKSGWQTTKISGASGAAAGGDAFDITFTAGKNQRISFAAMFGESNDWFFAPGPEGIALYD